MADRDELRALAQRVIALAGPNFAIEQEIGAALGLPVFPHATVTASLDAAMTLAKMCDVSGAEILRRALAMAGADVDALPRYVTAAALLALAEQVPA